MITLMLQRAQTLSISIACPPSQVYEFVSDPANLPRWAGGLCKAARPAGGRWLLDTPAGELAFRFAPSNSLGVLDHFIGEPGDEVYVPARVIANGEGSELLLTLFQTPAMPDSAFAADARLVEQDLAKLKRLLEAAQ